jgi:hypothetical protein
MRQVSRRAGAELVEVAEPDTAALPPGPSPFRTRFGFILGALLGVGLAARTGPVGRAVLLAGIAGLTAASEKVSFTAVIDRTPVLRELDALGRRPS